jgi:hypothetical protein
VRTAPLALGMEETNLREFLQIAQRCLARDREQLAVVGVGQLP